MALPTSWATSNVAGVDLTAVWSATANTAGTYSENVQPYAPFDAGMVVDMLNGGKAVYVKFGTGGVTNNGYAVVMPSAGPYTAAVMTSTSVGKVGDKVGVFLGTTAALVNDYGWLQVYGYNPSGVQTAASVGANAALLSSATAGQLATGTSTGTTAIGNIFLTAAAGGSAGLTACELNYPAITAVN